MNELLNRVFDEYGLVICGWSGTYIAFIDALKRARSRYMIYWVSRGEPSEAERSLTSFIRGTSIEAEGADEFFTELLERSRRSKRSVVTTRSPRRSRRQPLSATWRPLSATSV